jgi:hypothetical protein
LEVISFGVLGVLGGLLPVVGIFERLVPDESWDVFRRVDPRRIRPMNEPADLLSISTSP